MNDFRKLAAALLLSSAAAGAQPERITFPDAVQRALARNPSIQIAVQEISRAHGIMREVRAAAIPTLTAGGVYTRLDADRTTVAATLDPNNVVTNQTRTVQPRDSWIASLQLAVPLIAPQRWVQWSHASEQIDVARLAAEDVRRQIAVTTARTYVSVLSAHRLVEANQHAADNARDHLEDSKARLSVGTGNRLDLVRASQELATSESLLQAALTGLLCKLGVGAANYLHTSGAPTHLRRALHAYNPSSSYVDAVLRYARRIASDRTTFFAFYSWQVFVKTPTGDRRVTGPGLP